MGACGQKSLLEEGWGKETCGTINRRHHGRAGEKNICGWA